MPKESKLKSLPGIIGIPDISKLTLKGFLLLVADAEYENAVKAAEINFKSLDQALALERFKEIIINSLPAEDTAEEKEHKLELLYASLKSKTLTTEEISAILDSFTEGEDVELNNDISAIETKFPCTDFIFDECFGILPDKMQMLYGQKYAIDEINDNNIKIGLLEELESLLSDSNKVDDIELMRLKDAVIYYETIKVNTTKEKLQRYEKLTHDLSNWKPMIRDIKCMLQLDQFKTIAESILREQYAENCMQTEQVNISKDEYMSNFICSISEIDLYSFRDMLLAEVREKIKQVESEIVREKQEKEATAETAEQRVERFWKELDWPSDITQQK